MASLATELRARYIHRRERRPLRSPDDEAWAAVERARPDAGRALRHRRADHRHLLPAVLRRRGTRSARMSNSSPPAPRRAAAGLARLPALPAGRGQPRGGGAGAGPSPARRRPRRRPRSRSWPPAAGYSPHHFHRLFKRATGVTPAAYYRSLRASAPRRRWPTMAGSPTRSTMPAIPGRRASMPTPRAGSA